jgi:hypothetical protein
VIWGGLWRVSYCLWTSLVYAFFFFFFFFFLNFSLCFYLLWFFLACHHLRLSIIMLLPRRSYHHALTYCTILFRVFLFFLACSP